MKNPSAFRFWAPVQSCSVHDPVAHCMFFLRTGNLRRPTTQPLLDKARALEVRGRVDLAAQIWQQVLLGDPNNTEALGGLARRCEI